MICCVTLISSTWHGGSAWRLRVMATAPDLRKQGIATGMLQYLPEDLREFDQVRPIWSNARVESARFFRNLGWRKVLERLANDSIDSCTLAVSLAKLVDESVETGLVRAARAIIGQSNDPIHTGFSK